jgi:hypothetical protein
MKTDVHSRKKLQAEAQVERFLTSPPNGAYQIRKKRDNQIVPVFIETNKNVVYKID